jgi:hypothetical protein
MNNAHHIEEHDLSRFALNDPKQKREDRESIARHLSSCDGCRALFEEIQSYYSGVSEELRVNTELGNRRKKEIMRQFPLPDVWKEPVSSMAPLRRVPAIAFVWHVVRKHPVYAGGGIGLFALTIFALVNYVLVPAVDNNPFDYRLNDDQKVLQIINKGNKVLWEKPWSGNTNYGQWEGLQNIVYTVIVDIDRNGKNEVVTIIPESGKKISGQNTIRAYTSDGKILWERIFGIPVAYRNQEYPNDYFAKDLTYRIVGNTVELYLMLVHTHSPVIIYRLNSSGEILGSYIHQGHFSGIQMIDADGDGIDDLVACGINDELDRPAIVVLDPDKIVGETEATPTRGFKKIPSVAEIFYLIVDTKPEDKVFRTVFLPGTKLREGKLSVRYYGKYGWMFSVAFEPGMKLIAVNETDQGRETYGEKVQLKIGMERSM